MSPPTYYGIYREEKLCSLSNSHVRVTNFIRSQLLANMSGSIANFSPISYSGHPKLQHIEEVLLFPNLEVTP